MLYYILLSIQFWTCRGVLRGRIRGFRRGTRAGIVIANQFKGVTVLGIMTICLVNGTVLVRVMGVFLPKSIIV
jgi:hypothetical protein